MANVPRRFEERSEKRTLVRESERKDYAGKVGFISKLVLKQRDLKVASGLNWLSVESVN
jgi:hypothetical protein